MSNQTSGIIINNDIFINADHVVKVEKFKNAEDIYEMDIYVTAGSPVRYFFDNEHECNLAFEKIVLNMYSYNCTSADFKTKTE